MVNYYSQHGEDFLLDKVFKNKKRGFFVEVGCIDGRRFSNTLTFEERGWHGLCVEAHAGYIELLRRNRPNSIVCHCAAGEKDEDNVIFFANVRGSLSTLDGSKEAYFRDKYGEYFSGFEEQRVPKRRLDTLFSDHGITEIDLLSLDVEGYEVEVLKGLDGQKYKPLVIVIESDSKEGEIQVDNILLTNGYTKSINVGCNVFYLFDPKLEHLIANKKFQVKLIHTRHPLDEGEDEEVETTIDTRNRNCVAGKSVHGETQRNKARSLTDSLRRIGQRLNVSYMLNWLPGGKKEMAVRSALKCKGWTDRRKLSILYDLAKDVSLLEGDFVEIGSAWGRSTALLGLATEKTIWLIDPHTGGRAFIERGEFQNSFEEFQANIKNRGVSARVRALKNTTKEVWEQTLVPDQTRFALVFVDGLHTPEGVRIDFQFSYDRLVNSGVMIFDDYFEPTLSDYTNEIDLLMEERGLTLIKDDDSGLVWFFRR